MKTEECMVRVLEETPGAKLIEWHKPQTPLAAGFNPFLEYSFRSHAISFGVSESKGEFLFATTLPTGLTTPGDNRPHDYDWGTAELEKKWKANCGAIATTVVA